MRQSCREVVFLLAVCLAVPMVVAETPLVGTDFVVVRVEISTEEEADFLSSFVDVWAVHPERGILDAAVDAEGEEVLRDFGFRYVIDRELTDTHTRPAAALKGQTEGIPGYPCYRTVEETLADGAALAVAHPDLAEWIDIGDSWEKGAFGPTYGYDLMVLRLTNTTSGIPSADKPKLWVMGAVHAREYSTAETVTRFAEHLLANYDLDPDVTWLLDHHELHILLQANPDGRKQAEAGASWRKNTNQNYCGPTSSYRGADLNRNHDFYWGCCGGSSSDPCDTTYRGASAASEPETQAVRDWITANFPDWRPDDLTTPAPDNATGIFIDVHSYGGDVFSAFGFQDPPSPNNAQMLKLGRKFSYFTGYYAKIGSNYAVDGATKDFGYGRIGMPAYTFELGTAFFQDCASFETTIYPNNLQALLYAARAVRAPYTQSSGPEVATPGVLPTAPMPGDPVTVTAVIDDTRYGPGESSPPASVEAITEAEAFIDVPPWQLGATPIALSASDGSFDSNIEAVTGVIDTTGLGYGRHTVYIRGRDAAGYWGTVRAVFFWLLDPAGAATITGTVTEAGTGAPLVGTVTAGAFSTLSAAADGAYSLVLPAGTYDVVAKAPDYGSQTAAGVVALAGGSTPLDFELQPFEAVFADDVESGNIGWTVEGLWAITSEASASPTHSWTDSPGGDYGDDWDYSLTSSVLDLTDASGVVLEFDHIYDLETGYDYGHLEVSTNGGSTWSTVATFNGVQTSSWVTEEIDLPALDNVANARIRFRIDTDGYITEDGWHIDDIVLRAVTAPPPGLVFRDDFESGGTSRWDVVVQ
jgi:hypothetical protein